MIDWKNLDWDGSAALYKHDLRSFTPGRSSFPLSGITQASFLSTEKFCTSLRLRRSLLSPCSTEQHGLQICAEFFQNCRLIDGQRQKSSGTRMLLVSVMAPDVYLYSLVGSDFVSLPGDAITIHTETGCYNTQSILFWPMLTNTVMPAGWVWILYFISAYNAFFFLSS